MADVQQSSFVLLVLLRRLTRCLRGPSSLMVVVGLEVALGQVEARVDVHAREERCSEGMSQQELEAVVAHHMLRLVAEVRAGRPSLAPSRRPKGSSRPLPQHDR